MAAGTSMTFHGLRRQRFLSKDAYRATVESFNKDVLPSFLATLESPESDDDDRRRVSAAIARSRFENFMLRFTAGESLDKLRHDLAEVIEAFELAAKYVRLYAFDEKHPPLLLSELDEYETTLQMIGLCYLLNRRELLGRIALLLDPAFQATDTLYEDLLSFEMQRFEVDEWHHDKPYRLLVNSFYRDSPAESIADINEYLKTWYMELRNVPWHDSHLYFEGDELGGIFWILGN